MKEELNRIYADMFSNACITTIMQEVEQFAQTIVHGKKMLDEYISDLHTTVLDGETAFKLYDTYGFPLELTQLLLQENKYSVDLEAYDTALEQARERSRQGSSKKFAK